MIFCEFQIFHQVKYAFIFIIEGFFFVFVLSVLQISFSFVIIFASANPVACMIVIFSGYQ